jgi:hypothetical protein
MLTEIHPNTQKEKLKERQSQSREGKKQNRRPETPD